MKHVDIDIDINIGVRWKAEMHRAQLNIAVRPIRMETKHQSKRKKHTCTEQNFKWYDWFMFCVIQNRPAWSSIKCANFVCSTTFNLRRSSMVHKQAYSIKYSWSVCTSKWSIDKITNKCIRINGPIKQPSHLMQFVMHCRWMNAVNFIMPWFVFLFHSIILALFFSSSNWRILCLLMPNKKEDKNTFRTRPAQTCQQI